ncbi:hypothetical protein Skr01_72400 [Sphaerisporangium krabiense]|uniref:Sirohydrochlorin cobaltochelatase n=1 Tax=Sphaerisporangium krabiense TaxID=763782 RepID=A0A7W8Z6S2_9ACTN|nr:sirohydrochlorin chelatase [Sphaerisporangium krabiense]MBB5628514.1 sirohydrochlorin cobaltochelatase [Sphaerisporangium krabiense]GII67155.1 hypothetical protein Skr01_72400 [Sphaerisporangium krabiense]
MKPPLLLIGHGAHDDTGAAEFGRFVHRLRCRLDGVAADVSGGFATRGRPALGDSIASLVARGHHRMVAIPLTLGHSDDIPAALARARVAHPTLTYDYGRSLAASPRALALMAERLADALAEMPRLAAVPAGCSDDHDAVREPVSPAETAVVLVGHGSRETAANAEVHRVSRLFWETHAPGLLTVETAYVSDAPPSVAQGIERCRRLGAKRVVVLPYLLFAGAVLERIWAEALAYAAGHVDLDVRCAEVIGDCEGLADLIIERYESALSAVEPVHVLTDEALEVSLEEVESLKEALSEVESSELATELATEVVAEPAIESITGSVAEPGTALVAEPVAEPAGGSVAGSESPRPRRLAPRGTAALADGRV